MSDLPLPALDEFGLQPLRFLETDSKMSTILLASDAQNRLRILKIARVDQQVRADLNRQAILNTIEWCTSLGPNPGIAGIYPIASQATSTPGYLAQLRCWQGTPEFLVMEYLPGGSLRDLVGQQRLPLELALPIALGVAQALAFIHQQGCVHRDLKPENILFRTPPAREIADQAAPDPPLPILIDFGVAARAGESRFVSGSRLWMAPELQEAYERYPLPVDPAWDLYALGLIVCYMVSGLLPRRRAYDWESYQHYHQRCLARLARELSSRFATESQAASQLSSLLAATLAKEPESRPSADAFAKRLAAIMRQLNLNVAQPESAWVNPLPALHRRAQSPRRFGLHSFNLRSGAVLAMLVLLLTLVWVLFNLPFRRQQISPVLDSQGNVATPATEIPLQPSVTAAATQPPAPTLVAPATQVPSSPTLAPPKQAEQVPTLVPLPVTAIEDPPTLLPRTQ